MAFADVRIEQKELRWGDIVLKTDSDGKEYLECRQTKTRTGDDPRNQRPIKPRMYANNDAISIDRDSVHVYKMYKEKTTTIYARTGFKFLFVCMTLKQKLMHQRKAKTGSKNNQWK